MPGCYSDSTANCRTEQPGRERSEAVRRHALVNLLNTFTVKNKDSTAAAAAVQREMHCGMPTQVKWAEPEHFKVAYLGGNERVVRNG